MPIQDKWSEGTLRHDHTADTADTRTSRASQLRLRQKLGVAKFSNVVQHNFNKISKR